MEEVLKLPREWAREDGIRVLDADGWMGKDGRSWFEPISREEFDRRVAISTVGPWKYSKESS